MRKQPPKKMAAPKITFVGGTKLTSTGLVKTDAGSSGSGASVANSTAGTATGQDTEMEEGQCLDNNIIVSGCKQSVAREKFYLWVKINNQMKKKNSGIISMFSLSGNHLNLLLVMLLSTP